MIAPATNHRRIHVMHLVDTLDVGGRERMVVSLANLMPRDRYTTQICTTRHDGPLRQDVAAHVDYLCLNRKRTVEPRAVRRLVEFIRRNRTEILHAHGTAVFVASLAAMLPPRPAIVWHDHFGTNEQHSRPAWLYRLMMRRVNMVLAVSEPLAGWSRDCLRLPEWRVRCLPNFVHNPPSFDASPDLPGQAGERVVCVANLRPAKDHPTLLRAMQLVVAQRPAAHLLLVGAQRDPSYCGSVQQAIQQLGLERNVTLLGARNDVADVLRACDVGVLSSVSEGLPVSLLEYGAAGLPVVATGVGQCADVLDHGRAGVVVPPSQPARLAEGILSLLGCERKRAALAQAFRQRVAEVYSAEAVVDQLGEVYQHVLQRNPLA